MSKEGKSGPIQESASVIDPEDHLANKKTEEDYNNRMDSKEDFSKMSEKELEMLTKTAHEGMATGLEKDHKIRGLISRDEEGKLLKSYEDTLEIKVDSAENGILVFGKSATNRADPTGFVTFLEGYGISKTMQDMGFGSIGNMIIDKAVGKVPERYFFMTKVATTIAVNQALLALTGAASAGTLTILSLKLDAVKKKLEEVSKKVDTIIKEPMKTAGDHFLRAIFHIEAGDYEETLPDIREAINNSLKALNYIKENKKYMQDVVTCTKFLALGDQLMEKYDKENKIFLPYDILPIQKKIKLRKITKDHLDSLFATNNQNKEKPSVFKGTEKRRLMEVAHHDVVDEFARQQFPFLVPPGSMIPPKYLPAGHVDAVIYNIHKKTTWSQKHLGNLLLMWKNEEETHFRVIDGHQLLEFPIVEDEEIDISMTTSGMLLFSASDGKEIIPTSLFLYEEYPNIVEDWQTNERDDCLKLYNAFSQINRKVSLQKKNEVLWQAAKNRDIDKITYAINIGAEMNSRELAPIIDQSKVKRKREKVLAFVGKEASKIVEKTKNNFHKGQGNSESTKQDGAFRENKSALHYTSEAGHVECSRRLLELGANPNIEDADSFTPLHLAARSGHLETVEVLCEAGANIRAHIGKGITALDITADTKIKEYLTLLMDKADAK